jgi:AraC family transcriptional regulator
MTSPPRAWADYTRALQRVAAHIEAHAESSDASLDLASLAEVAHLSPHHFHRVYHSMLGETVADAVMRIRLQRCAMHLARSELSVAQIAQRCGFASSASLVRAFKQRYGVTPGAYRSSGPHQAFNPQAVSADTSQALEVTVQPMPEQHLVVSEHQGAYIRVGEAFERCHLLAQRHARSQGAGPLLPVRVAAVYLHDPAGVSESALRSWAGYGLTQEQRAACEPWPEPLRSWVIPAGPVAVLRYRGPYASMQAAYRWLFGQWLPQSGHSPADHPVWEDYLNHPRDTAPADLLTHICLPLAPRPTMGE